MAERPESQGHPANANDTVNVAESGRDGMSEADFLEAVGNAAAKGAPPAVAGMVKEAAIAVERWQLRRATNDYDRIQRARLARLGRAVGKTCP